jgi:hypothetical protein
MHATGKGEEAPILHGSIMLSASNESCLYGMGFPDPSQILRYFLVTPNLSCQTTPSIILVWCAPGNSLGPSSPWYEQGME